MHIFLPTLSGESLRHLGHGEQDQNTTNGIRSKSRERTLMMASDGHDFTFGPYSSSGCLFPMIC